jgi:mannose-1-phosphate guanylyltransferase
MPEIYAVIMAGGRGERFWPLSTPELPKPFIPLLGSSSLLQETVSRILPIVPLDRILISIGADHFNIARRQLPQVPPQNFIVEPMGRDTAACIGFCSLHIEKMDPEGMMLALPADHYVGDASAYLKTLRLGIENLEGATGVVFGISPTRPETGYGYILTEKPSRGSGAWPVIRFIEKPNASKAKQYLESGNYFWNSGMFLWSNQTLLELFQTHMPETYSGMAKLRPLIGKQGSDSEISRIFGALPRISIDYGIVEKTSGLRLIPAQFTWDDIGNWASLERALASDSSGNTTRGSCTLLESNDCIIYSRDGTIATFGVSNLVIVEAYGKVLVCSKDRAADLKKLVSSLGPKES